MKIGRRTADTLVLEGTFGAPIGPTFTLMAQKLLAADRALNGGANSGVICSAMTARGILSSVDCTSAPRGELTFFQSPEHGVTGTNIASTIAITDSRAIQNLNVNVAVAGDAQITLIGPDGTRAKLQSLDSFRGRSAAGMWTLSVTSTAPVTLTSWSLVIHFAGDVPLKVRPAASANQQKFIAAVARAPGANGTTFITNVRLFNRGASSAQVTAVFTPTGGDGRTNFAAVKIVMQPAQIVAIDDIVHTLLQSAGTGQLQIVGANDQILINSRTYTPSSSGTYGQFVPSAVASESVGAGDLPLSIPGLENTSAFRSNIGFAEVAGMAGEIRVRFYDAAGNAVADEVYGIAPFGHVQTRVNPFGEALRAEVTVAGGARVLAYGSMVDNSSGDAVFIPAAWTRSGIFPAIHAPGANGTLWRTDVWLSNPGATAEDVVMNQRSFTVPAHGSVVVRDVLGVDGRAALQVDTAAVLVTSRT